MTIPLLRGPRWRWGGQLCHSGRSGSRVHRQRSGTHDSIVISDGFICSEHRELPRLPPTGSTPSFFFRWKPLIIFWFSYFSVRGGGNSLLHLPFGFYIKTLGLKSLSLLYHIDWDLLGYHLASRFLLTSTPPCQNLKPLLQLSVQQTDLDSEDY